MTIFILAMLAMALWTLLIVLPFAVWAVGTGDSPAWLPDRTREAIEELRAAPGPEETR